MAANDDPSEQFLAWQRSPDRSASGAIVGLVIAWLVGGYLILGMVKPPGGTAAVSGVEFLSWMAGPVAVAAAACTDRRVRYWAGAFLPGAIVGWTFGCFTFVLIGLLGLLIGVVGLVA